MHKTKLPRKKRGNFLRNLMNSQDKVKWEYYHNLF
jgi:hypothetical protein